MTVKLPRWFGKPPEVFELGRHVGMSRGSAMLYDYLCWMSDRRSSRRFEIEDEEVVKMSDVSKRRLGDAREELSKRGLVICDRQPGARCAYTICNPATGLPYPGDPKAKIAYTKKSSSPAPKPAVPDEAPTVLAAKALPENTGDACEAGLDDCDVSFEFGWNVVTLAEQPIRYAFEFG